MRFFHHLPIKRKLRMLFMLTSGVALLMACAIFATYDQVVYRRTIASEISVLTDLYDDSVASGLAFTDPKSIEQTLRSLDGHPRILAAAVYDLSGRVVAQYQRADLKTPFAFPSVRETSTQFEKDRIDSFRSVLLAGEKIGTVYITSDLRALEDLFWHSAIIIMVVLVVALLVAFVLSAKLGKIISEPISELAKVANAVAAEKNYSIRAVRKSEDELGRLIDGFNEMLDQIQTRDSALREARDNLEKRVDERTRDLQLEIQERKETEAKLESTHKQLVDASRQAGMAEVASSVLHNVGNVLNSVNVSATLVADNVRKSKAANLARVAAILQEHSSDLGTFITLDPKGKQLPGYLAQLSECLGAEQEAIVKEMRLLRNNIEHIKDIVAMQQSYAKVLGVVEVVKVTDLVEDALRMNGDSLTHAKVQIAPRVAPAAAGRPLQITDRHCCVLKIARIFQLGVCRRIQIG